MTLSLGQSTMMKGHQINPRSHSSLMGKSPSKHKLHQWQMQILLLMNYEQKRAQCVIKLVCPPKGSFKYSKSVKLSAWLSKHSSVLKMRRKTKYIYIKNKTHHITSLKHHFHWEGPERNTDVTSFYNIMTFAGWAVFPKTVAKFSVGIQQIHINHSYKNCWLMKT